VSERPVQGYDEDVPSVNDLLSRAYEPLLELADRVDEEEGWRPTSLPGWTVRDLLFHLASDAQRALVALATPAHGAADTDHVRYWEAWKPGTTGAHDGLRGTRIIASAWSSVRGPADLFADTARAVMVALDRADPSEVVRTQGRRMSVVSLARTLAVEAGVHHLDLGLPSHPDPLVLKEICHVVEELLGQPLPDGWDARRCALLGTGRVIPTDAERAALGVAADRLHVFC
jgi:hypothetical protein